LIYHRVEEAFDRGDDEVARRHRQRPNTVVLAPLALAREHVWQICSGVGGAPGSGPRRAGQPTGIGTNSRPQTLWTERVARL
jgi:hypothetical protein